MPQDTSHENLESLVLAVVNSYSEQPSFLPNKEEIIDILEMVRKLLFPGYFKNESTELTDLYFYVGSMMMELGDKLQKQVCRALLHDTTLKGTCGADAESLSAQIAYAFLTKIPKLREILLTDVDATLDGDPAARNKHEIIFAYPGIFAISVYRIAHELHVLGVPLIPRIMTEHAHSITGIDIHPGAAIGHHFFIDHGTGIVVGETTEIGNYVKIYQGVTLGALSTRGGQSLQGKKRHPTLEDEVTVYSSTSILGGETVIGRGAVIGANAFITRSVPPGTRVSIKTPDMDFKTL
ncbi:serine O-acetyltransferase [Sporobacter termitidis DSM 10068]|uniref:Serine O-acetyltransferase n=1 Tax=Sporobacter termitidis DSM 10068 TaxID=1123282 RepID=A0A1M5Z1A1_9FIRM|nr:serine O-acetyltransferase EpsC [Sporobacter termitidis]SHI17858.1 serine O-acetyltransferase [Sporobacter termitidis DSM 10068]